MEAQISRNTSFVHRLDELQTARLQPDMSGLRPSSDKELRALIGSIIREELHAQASPCHLEVRTTPPGANLREVVKEEVASMTGTQVRSPHPVPAPTYAQIAAMTPPLQHHHYRRL
ncbi:hypothetical protein HPB52_021401 [Rhipicephalus sanguineus]|uniref:Uncharacterized protein n=1 Tax=Rhipicephalus sanguineus TaxID=34632 RepID=A0A9D4PKN0_RHISA|nr:hypothetical protein HPB52_021401 [Rhipicephalus sanguineus]